MPTLQNGPLSTACFAASAAPYRDDLGVRARHAELSRQRQIELQRIPPRARRVYASRLGRTASGLVGTLGAFVIATRVLGTHGGLTEVLFATLPVALGAYVMAYVFGLLHLRAELRAAMRPNADLYGDLSRLESLHPGRLLGELVRRLEWPSVAFPLIALSLLGPLGIHFVVGSLIGLQPIPSNSFDEWMKISLILVPHCHVVLAALACRWASRLALRSADDLITSPYEETGSVLALTIGSSLIPGVMMCFAPTVIVGVTGALLIPFMFANMARRVGRERLLLASEDETSAALPGEGGVAPTP